MGPWIEVLCASATSIPLLQLLVTDGTWNLALQADQQELWSTIARIVTAANVLLLVGLSYIWGRNYLQIRSKYTLGLFVFGLLLFFRNCWGFYIYQFDPVLAGWFASEAVPEIAWHAMLSLHVLEFVALVFLAWVTWD